MRARGVVGGGKMLVKVANKRESERKIKGNPQ